MKIEMSGKYVWVGDYEQWKTGSITHDQLQSRLLQVVTVNAPGRSTCVLVNEGRTFRLRSNGAVDEYCESSIVELPPPQSPVPFGPDDIGAADWLTFSETTVPRFAIVGVHDDFVRDSQELRYGFAALAQDERARIGREVGVDSNDNPMLVWTRCCKPA